MSKTFPCVGCGACCTVIKQILETPIEEIEKEYREEVKDFPHKALENGSCEMLDQLTLKCKVYEDRPLLCQIDSHHKKKLKDKISLSDYHDETKVACKYLMRTQLGWSESKIKRQWEE